MPGIWDEFKLRIRAHYPLLYALTHEEVRLAANLKRVAKDLDLPLYTYSEYSGFTPPLGGESAAGDPLKALADSGRSGLFILQDFHTQLSERLIVRQFKDLRERFIKNRQTLVISAPTKQIPAELEKYFAILDIPLPDLRELASLFWQIAARHTLTVNEAEVELFARSATGLTAEEAMLIFSRVMLQPEQIERGDTSTVIEEKRRLVESEGVLEFYERQVNLDDVGGLHALKHWLNERESAFSTKAREFGLPAPKGLLLLGVQGCGKSLTAKAIASHFRLPLVQLDLTAAFGAKNAPEEAIRRALKLLEAMAPVVVWIDEIEKGFAGSKDSGGDMSLHRIFGHFITWLQEKQAPVFVVATANRVEELPPELLRKGRFDELFFVDLPDGAERREVLGVHFKRRQLDPNAFDLDELVAQTRNFTGAELEQLVTDALYRAFAVDRTVTMSDFNEIIRTLVPIYNTYEEDIKALRDWCRERTRAASVDSSLTDYFEREKELP